MLVIIKTTPVMWSSSSINTQFFKNFKSCSVSQFIKGKSRNLQKLLRYLSGIVTSVFKGSIGSCTGCGGWDPFGFSGGCAGRASLAFVLSLLLYLSYILMIYHLRHYHHHHHHWFGLYNNSISFLISWNNFDYILTDCTSTWLYEDLMHWLSMYCWF